MGEVAGPAELASAVCAQPSNVGSVLKGLEAERMLQPGRQVRRRLGFYYTPA
jgi:hypothetical protein